MKGNPNNVVYKKMYRYGNYLQVVDLIMQSFCATCITYSESAFKFHYLIVYDKTSDNISLLFLLLLLLNFFNLIFTINL